MKVKQKEFLLDTFFSKYLTGDYAGWRGIAEKLIDTGEIITPNTAMGMWRGGIGNFIKVGEAGNQYIDCIKMTFDVKEFVSRDNLFFMEYYNHHLEEAQKGLQEARENYEAVKSLA